MELFKGPGFLYRKLNFTSAILRIAHSDWMLQPNDSDVNDWNLLLFQEQID